MLKRISNEERLIQEINKVKELRATLSQVIADLEYVSMMADIELTHTEEEEDNE